RTGRILGMHADVSDGPNAGAAPATGLLLFIGRLTGGQTICALAGLAAEWLWSLDELQHISFEVIEERQLALARRTGRAAGERDSLGAQRVADGVEVADRKGQVTPPGVVARPVRARRVGGGNDLYYGRTFRRADEPRALGPALHYGPE